MNKLIYIIRYSDLDNISLNKNSNISRFLYGNQSMASKNSHQSMAAKSVMISVINTSGDSTSIGIQ